MDFESIVKKMQESLQNTPLVASTTPEEDAARKATYEAEQEDKRALLRGLRNQMVGDCERFNATWVFTSDCHTGMTTVTSATRNAPTELITQRERLQLTEAEWGALHAQAEYEMRSVANHISVVLRKHLGTIQGSNTAAAAKRPVGRPSAPKPPMALQPWTPAIWEDELESWHAAAAERNPQHPPANVRVAHDLYLETLFAHLQRLGYPHPFKAGFTAI